MKRGVLEHQRRALERLLPRERADDEPLAGHANGVEIRDAVDVDDRARRGQAQVEGGYQALAAARRRPSSP